MSVAVKRKPLAPRLWEQKLLYLMLLPALLWLVLFQYVPMFGIYMAFTNYSPGGDSFLKSFFGAQWVGLQWFGYFFNNGDFLRIMRNTLATSLLTLIISFPAPIVLAVLINECCAPRFRKFVQTASYLPYFISWVIVANMVVTLLSAGGVVNHIIRGLGFASQDVLFFQEGKYFWWIIAFSNTWKGAGYGAILYLAAITAINPELYEAAVIDGASRMQKIMHITLPSIKSTVTMLLIFAVSGLLNAGFDQQMLLMNPSVMDYADVIDTYVYRYGLLNSMFSYAAAVGLFKSIVSFLLLWTANMISRKVSENSLF